VPLRRCGYLLKVRPLCPPLRAAPRFLFAWPLFHAVLCRTISSADCLHAVVFRWHFALSTYVCVVLGYSAPLLVWCLCPGRGACVAYPLPGRRLAVFYRACAPLLVLLCLRQGAGVVIPRLAAPVAAWLPTAVPLPSRSCGASALHDYSCSLVACTAASLCISAVVLL
jgi:hypothetical protein